MWNERLMVPANLRGAVIEILHKGRPGIESMQTRARYRVGWPDIEQKIKEKVQHCERCQRFRPKVEKQPIIPWDIPAEQWSRVHIDLAGPIQGEIFSVVVDAHTKMARKIKLSTTATTQ